MKKMIGPLGIGMAIGATIMGAYAYMMPKRKQEKMKKAFKSFADEMPSVKIK